MFGTGGCDGVDIFWCMRDRSVTTSSWRDVGHEMWGKVAAGGGHAMTIVRMGLVAHTHTHTLVNGKTHVRDTQDTWRPRSVKGQSG